MPLAPEAIRVRPAREDDALNIACVHVRSWQTAYRGILPDSFLDALEPQSREERWREALRPSAEGRFTFVAEAPVNARSGDNHLTCGEIVGFATGGPERDGIEAGGARYEGEIYGLYLLQEYRRHGIGRRLVAAAVEVLLRRGQRSIVIWALQDNRPARAFYEQLGGALIAEKTVTIGPSNLVDVAYGWPDGQDLLRAAQARVSGIDGGLQ